MRAFSLILLIPEGGHKPSKTSGNHLGFYRANMTPSTISAITNSLSPGRMGTFYTAVDTAIGSQDQVLGLKLYAWNASVASSFIIPLHFYEVALRNAISTAIENTYSNQWPWQSQFIRSLSPKGRYSPRADLTSCNQKCSTTGKVIPELKFAFWEQMLKNSHMGRIWSQQFRTVFPHSPGNESVKDCLDKLRDNTYKIRSLRNRIAHHEPIFSRQLQDEFNILIEMIEWICPATVTWLKTQEKVSSLLQEKPI